MSRIVSGFISSVVPMTYPPRVVSNQEQVFLYELLMSDEERRLYNAVMNSPGRCRCEADVFGLFE